MIPFMIIFFVITLMWEQEEEFKVNRKSRDNPWVRFLIFLVIY